MKMVFDFLKVTRYLAALVVITAVSGMMSFASAEQISLRVGMYENAPLIYHDEAGKISGIFPDILKDIARKEGWTLEYIPGSFADSMRRLKNGSVNILPAVAFSEERATDYLFNNETAITNWGRVYARKGSGIESIVDLRGKRVAVVRDNIDYVGPEGIVNILKKFNVNVRYIEYDGYLEIMAALKKGEADAAVLSRLYGEINARDPRIEKTSIILNPIQIRFAFNPADIHARMLLNKIDSHLLEMKSDPGSVYHDIIDLYLDAHRPHYYISPVVWLLIRIGLLLLVIFLTSTVLFQFKIRKKTFQLRGYANRLELALTGSQSGLWDWDIQKDDAVLDKRCADLLGYTLDELTPANLELFKKLVHRDDREHIIDIMGKIMSGEIITLDDEIRMMRKDGKPLHMLLRGRVVEHDKKGAPARLIGTVTNITSLKDAESALRESEERYRSIFRNNHAVMLIIDPDNGYIVDVNAAAAEFYGWSEEELKSMNISEINILPPEEIKSKMNEVFRHGMDHLFFKHKTADRSVKNVEVYTGKVTFGGKHLLYSIVHDITPRVMAQKEKELLEKQLRHSQKLETIGTLAGGIAHDFNNILVPIIGYAEIAKHALKDASDPVRGYLQSILQAGTRAKELVRQLLAFSKQTEHEKRPVNMSALVKESIGLLRSIIPTTIDIEIRLCPDCRIVMGDPVQIQQIIINLCTNAYHAMEENGGLLLVEVKRAVFADNADVMLPGLDPMKEYIVLRVKDNGAGMDDATLERIFEPFFTTKSVDKGSGMGLAVVHGIVKSHGGAVHVESEKGRGSEFKVFFPAEEGAADLYEPEAVMEMLPGTGRVLLVDDDSDITAMLKDFLEQTGYTVTVFNDGSSACETFREDPDSYDFVITDLTMPGVTGLMLTSSCKELNPNLHVILMTGYVEKISSADMLNAGVDTFVMKPIDLNELSRILFKYNKKM